MTSSRRRGLATAVSVIGLLLACGTSADPALPDHIRQAIEHPARSDADRTRDLTSRPGEVLTFLDLQPGMTVFDMLGGDGYYSEIVARAVGPEGRVYLHNNQGYAGLMRSLPRRLAGDRLEALEVYVREIGDINLPSDSVDMVLLVKVYHDLYYLNNGWNVPPGPFFDTIHRILKPGGTLAVIDHAAPPGTGAGYAQNLHRIDPAFAWKDIESRGFEFVAESALLINEGDDMTRSPFRPDVRGRTSRFLHRYRKP